MAHFIFSSQTSEDGGMRASVMIFDVLKPMTPPLIHWFSEWRNTGHPTRDYTLGKIELLDRIREAERQAAEREC